MSDGSVWAWGFNFYGELGNLAALGLYTPQPTPVQVMVNASTPLSGVTKIVAIGNSSFAVDKSGELWAWGENSFGQLGQGGSNTTNLNYATPVPGFSTGTVLYSP
jgi:alpha-tubulin suppressor-like RCC1 family protein